MPNKNAVSIITDRLLLNKHTREDFDDCAKLWSNPVVTRYIGGEPLDIEASWAKFLRSVGHWLVMGFGYWAVREKTTGLLVGEVGFGHYKRPITKAFSDTPEVGWVLNPAFHGQGYATEAVSAILDWGDQHLPSKRTVCLIDPDNAASIRLAQKMGYSEFGRELYHDEINILFERHQPHR